MTRENRASKKHPKMFRQKPRCRQILKGICVKGRFSVQSSNERSVTCQFWGGINRERMK